MPRISVVFFALAALCALAGMVWGGYMGASGDHSLFPAHAHLNLLGWVSLAIMGGFYALPGARHGRLAWVNLILSAGGAILMAPMLVWVLKGHERDGGPLMVIPEGMVIAGMIAFLVGVLRSGRGAAA